MCDYWFQDGGALEKNKSQASFFTQCQVLTRRSFINMYRDLGYYWLRLGIYIALSVVLATVFSHMGMSYGSIQVSERKNICTYFIFHEETNLISILQIKMTCKTKSVVTILIFSGKRFTNYVCSIISNFHGHWWIPFFCGGNEGS